MNRFKTRLAAVIAGSAVAVVLGGCSAGQISQTADQDPAVNGAQGAKEHVALRDVRIQATQTGEHLPAHHNVDLVFVATNQSADTADELTGISSGVGTVTVTGDKTLPVNGALIVGPPAHAGEASAKDLEKVPGTAVRTANATVALNEPITNGINYEFTFNFAKAGPITLAVPISAGEKSDGPAEHH